MSVSERITIAPFLNIVILDQDSAFCERLKVLLSILGFREQHAMQSATEFFAFVKSEDCNLAFVEIADDFAAVWAQMETVRKRGVLIVGVSEDRSGRDWVPAVQRGADTILLKPYYPHLLREMLLHLIESPAARRCRVVQLPVGRQQAWGGRG